MPFLIWGLVLGAGSYLGWKANDVVDSSSNPLEAPHLMSYPVTSNIAQPTSTADILKYIVILFALYLGYKMLKEVNFKQ